MNIYYRLYVEQIVRLVSTLVIKSTHAIDQMNAHVRLQGIEVDSGLPHTWKYYMNLHGDYHALDTPMTITSQDTFEEIPFTKESLADHLITKRAYLEYGRFYKTLVETYPTQELLIKGILDPIPYDDAIAARNHKILSYDTGLVEPQEQFLIPEIQEYVDGIYDRWYNVDYQRIEPMYATYMDALLYANLPMQILLSRKRRRYTDLAHSYHIRMYLLSFSKKVGDEFNYLSREQRLWLYRNIRYINLNLGTNETLDVVVRKIMNLRGFPVVATQLEFDYENILTELHPTIKTFGATIGRLPGQSLNIGGVDDVLGRQLRKAPLNSAYRTYDRERFETKYLRNRFDKLTTKVLESNIIDTSDAEPFTFGSAVINYWPFLAHAGYYDARMSITVPTTGQVHQLDMMEAYVLYVYLITAYENVVLEEIPCFYLPRVLRLLPPRSRELEALRMSYTPRYFLEYISAEIPIIQRLISPIAFNEKVIEIHRVQNDLRTTRHFQDDYKIEGNLHQIIDRYFHSVEIRPFEGESYGDWLVEREIDIETWTREDLIEVSNAIYERATGTSVDKGSALKNLHAAMVRILEQLTSYSVHMLTSVNDDGVKILDTKFPKQSVPVSEENHSGVIDIHSPVILEVDATLTQQINLDLTYADIQDTQTTESGWLDVPVQLGTLSRMSVAGDIPAQITVPSLRIIEPEDVLLDGSLSPGDSHLEYNHTGSAVDIGGAESHTYQQMTENRMKHFLRI